MKFPLLDENTGFRDCNKKRRGGQRMRRKQFKIFYHNKVTLQAYHIFMSVVQVYNIVNEITL